MKNLKSVSKVELIGKEIKKINSTTRGIVLGVIGNEISVNLGEEVVNFNYDILSEDWEIVDGVIENEEVVTDEIEDEINEKVEENETEEVIDEDEIVEETEEVIDEENIEDESKTDEVIEEETEKAINENDEDEITEETEEVINESDETEEFILETENRGIIDNIKETEGRVKITGHLYGIPVKFDKINQTTVWKTLNRLYDNRKNENDEYSLDDKKYLVRQLKQLDEKVFAGAFRCLVSKTKQNYIEELMK